MYGNSKMSKCKTCGHDISKSARTCPKCGEKNPHGKMSIFVKALIAIFCFMLFGEVMKDINTPASIATPRTVESVKASHSDKSKQAVWMETGKDAVREKLKDGGSAKFKDVFFHSGKDGVPMTCGKVNSKNSFGAYGGFQAFVSAGSPELTFLQEEVADFENVWKRLCVEK